MNPPTKPNTTVPSGLDPGRVVEVVSRRTRLQPTLGLVLGSGFGSVTAEVEVDAEFPYADLPGFPVGTVPGHAGRLILGRIARCAVAVLDGRAHYYEGHDPGLVTFPIRVLASLGVRSVLLTNAAGGIREDFEPGMFVALTDHINWMGVNPLRGAVGPGRFVDLSEVYDPALRARLHRAATESGNDLREGVYAAVSGPSYETPAEIRALARLGADLVGMSTVPEAIVARACGLAVAGLSCVTNRAAGLGGRISHEEVLAVGRRVADPARRLVARFAGLQPR